MSKIQVFTYVIVVLAIQNVPQQADFSQTVLWTQHLEKRLPSFKFQHHFIVQLFTDQVKCQFQLASLAVDRLANLILLKSENVFAFYNVDQKLYGVLYIISYLTEFFADNYSLVNGESLEINEHNNEILPSNVSCSSNRQQPIKY